MQDAGNNDYTANGGSENRASPDLPRTYEPAIRIVVPGKPDAIVRLEGVPDGWLKALEEPKKGFFPWSSIFKDIVPGLTSLAAVLISLAALIFTTYQKNAAENLAKDQREKAADAAQKKFRTDLIGSFNGLPIPTAETNANQIAAMKLAVYGEQALPAVRMALGSNDEGLRYGGEMVIEQMYVAETVPHQKLTQEILAYYPTGSAVLRRGVLEWLAIMGNELQDGDREVALTTVLDGFGNHAETCKQQDQELVRAGAHVLLVWSLAVSGKSRDQAKDLALGIVETCKADPTRTEALNALVAMKTSLSQEEQKSIVARLKKCMPLASASLRPSIDNAITEFLKIEPTRDELNDH